MSYEVIHVIPDGHVQFNGHNEERLIRQLVGALCDRYDLTTAIIGYDSDRSALMDLIDTFVAEMRSAHPRIHLIKASVCDSIISSLAHTHFGFGFYFYSAKGDGSRSMICFNQHGFALNGSEINAILENKHNKPETIQPPNTVAEHPVIQDMLTEKFTAMIFSPTLNILQIAHLNFTFLTPSKRLQDYLKLMTDYIGISMKVVREITDAVSQLETATMAKHAKSLESLMNKAFEHAPLAGSELAFYISKDGQRLIAGTVTTTGNNQATIQLINEEDVALVLAWWAIFWHQYETDFEIHKLLIDETVNSWSRIQQIDSNKNKLTPLILMEKSNKNVELLARRMYANIAMLEDEAEIMRRLRQNIEKSRMSSDRVVFCFTKGRKYLLNEKRWDAVAAAFQLCQIGILVYSIQRISIQELIVLIKAKYCPATQ